jgi:hypothetical protein
LYLKPSTGWQQAITSFTLTTVSILKLIRAKTKKQKYQPNESKMPLGIAFYAAAK